MDNTLAIILGGILVAALPALTVALVMRRLKKSDDEEEERRKRTEVRVEELGNEIVGLKLAQATTISRDELDVLSDRLFRALGDVKSELKADFEIHTRAILQALGKPGTGL